MANGEDAASAAPSMWQKVVKIQLQFHTRARQTSAGRAGCERPIDRTQSSAADEQDNQLLFVRLLRRGNRWMPDDAQWERKVELPVRLSDQQQQQQQQVRSV